MNGTPFKLGTFAKAGVASFAGIVLGDDVINLKAAPNSAALSSTESIDGLLEDWDANFAVLQKICETLRNTAKGRQTGRGQTCKPARAAAGAGPARCSTRRRTFRSTSTKCCAPA